MKQFIIQLLVVLGFCTIFAGLAQADQVYIDPGSYAYRLCHTPGYKCMAVPKNASWSQLWPDKVRREIVMRLNRTNVALKYRSWVVLPTDWKDLDYMKLSPFPDHIVSPGEKLLLVDLNKFAFAAYNEAGYLVYWGPATGGEEWCDDINENCSSALGDYRIYRMQGEDCESSRFPIETDGGAPMPYCMHYYKGYAIHGSTLSGFVNTSRGCIRIFDEDAEWLNREFITIGTKVIVKQG